jgi:methyl-accepting chemotaxis protein
MARWVTAAMVLAALLISGVMAWRITRSITKPVVDTVRMAEAIAAGDLTASLVVQRDDELGRLQLAVLAMQRQLNEHAGGICRLADQLASASGEIADGSVHLSQRTDETASSLQQTAAAIEQLSATVQRSVESARTANHMVSSTASIAQRGGQAVNEVVQRMGEIAAASGRIADITGVIDGIAFQTNILALNAAVEAARAGTHGRGFAVVATEVRALAQRATQSAREIKELIGASAKTVESGERLVKDAGETMKDIVDGVARATSMVDEICKAATSQSQGLGEVNQSVIRLDEMTQQNAALVQQSAASADVLRSQARELQALVKLQIGAGHSHPRGRLAAVTNGLRTPARRTRVAQGLEKHDQVGALAGAQMQRLEDALTVGVQLIEVELRIVVHHVSERGELAVVHVGCCQRHVAQAGYLELAEVAVLRLHVAGLDRGRCVGGIAPARQQVVCA